MAGLAVQNFLSAAVGMAVAVALIRGFARVPERRPGQLLGRPGPRHRADPAAVGLCQCGPADGRGVVQSFTDTTMGTLAGHSARSLTGGPVASQEAIKVLGTNGGGFFNANSAHPFENPNGVHATCSQMFLMLVIPISLPGPSAHCWATDARAARSWAPWVLWSISLAITRPPRPAGDPASPPSAAGAAMEGKETRFGEWPVPCSAGSTGPRPVR